MDNLFGSSCLISHPELFQKGDCTYEQVEFRLSNHNIEVDYNYEQGCTKDILILPDIPHEDFELVEFHIHTGTEHTLDGLFNAAELHLVHKSNSGMLAVIGIIIQAGLAQDNEQVQTITNGWEATAAKVKEACGANEGNNNTDISGNSTETSVFGKEVLGIYDFIPANESYYRYEGSLTTPPCTEIVHWSVGSRPIQISITQEVALVKL